MKNRNDKLEQKNARRDMIEAGGYDGRFRARVVPDKKKVASKKAARQKVKF